MLVALIDDGIDTFVCPCLRVRYDLSVGADGIIRNRAANDRILTHHGTTCARIIAKYAPNAEFCSLRIFHREAATHLLPSACSGNGMVFCGPGSHCAYEPGHKPGQ